MVYVVLALFNFLCVLPLQQMRRTGNKDENKRILMDLDVVLKSHDCPYIIQCYGAIVTNVRISFLNFYLILWSSDKCNELLSL